MPFFLLGEKIKSIYFVLVLILFGCNLFADESIISEETTPPRLVVDEQKKKIVQGKKKVKRENGWDFSLGVLYFQSSKDSDESRFFGLSYMILPFFGLSYKYNAFDARFTGMGIEGTYSFFDKPLGISSGISYGQKVEEKKYSDGYRAKLNNLANYSVGAFAYFLSANYTYYPVKITPPSKNSSSLDAHFFNMNLDLPGFPILLKPFLWFMKSSLRLNLMDDNYAKAYYNYYSADGQTKYSAGGGLNSFSYSLTSNIIFSEKWMFMFSFSREFFLEDAKNSPLTEDSAENAFFTMLMYYF